jgi:hypothetical protein
MRRTALAAAGLTLAVLCALAQAPRDAGADALLYATTSVTYDVRPDAGGTRVTWQVSLRDNDPQTVQRDQGFVYFYDRYAVPVLRGASGLRASGPGGAALGVSLQEVGEGPVLSAVVDFDRNLYYGQTYSFTVSYSLPAARSQSLLVTPYYVFLPAVAFGDVSTVTITTPQDSNWDVTVEELDCPETGAGRFGCAAPETVVAAAYVEVAQPDLLEEIETSVSLPAVPSGSTPLPITVRYFPGEQAWAAHVQELARAGLPVLGELFGAQVPDASRVEVSESGQRDILGYEGVATCRFDLCEIGISPVSDDMVALHELAHLWTTPFESRWLAEGLAEFMSRRAADRLGDLVSRNEREQPERLVDLQLHDWGGLVPLVGGSEEDRLREETGYAESLRLFETLEGMIGLTAIQEANRQAFERGSGVDSRFYMDYLEEASGARLDTLFLEEVFPPSYVDILERRRQARDRLSLMGPATEDAGLDLPPSIEDDVEDWRFDQALDALGGAQEGYAAYAPAKAKVERPRSFWDNFGLFGEDPDAALEEAAAAFAAGDFQGAIERAREAERIIDRTGRVALYRLLTIVGMALASIVAFGTIRLVAPRARQA